MSANSLNKAVVQWAAVQTILINSIPEVISVVLLE
jgi:hypothetical protein